MRWEYIMCECIKVARATAAAMLYWLSDFEGATSTVERAWKHLVEITIPSQVKNTKTIIYSMLIHTHSLESLIHLTCVSSDSGRKPKQAQGDILKTKISKSLFIKLWSDSSDTEIQLLPHTVHTQRDYAVSVTHPPSLWQQWCSHTSVTLAGAAWCCKQWQCYQKEACGARESKNETEKSTASAGDFRDLSRLAAGQRRRLRPARENVLESQEKTAIISHMKVPE